jgi:iron-sulfur cluster assembly protein
MESNNQNSFRIGNENLVRVTEEASAKVNELMQREDGGQYLRIRITGGGCNGLSYKMKFVNDGKSGDILVESNGISVLVDSKTTLYLRGTTLDYSSKLVAGGFKFSNPNAKASCSCGESFNL